MMSRRSMAAVVATAAFAGAAVAAMPASAAKTIQLKFFSQAESVSLTDASGNPLAGRDPAAGDKLVATDRNFAGNHRRHARRYSSTDHLSCTFTGPAVAVCDGQIAVGASLLLAEHVTVNLAEDGLTIPISGGTGRFHGMHGTTVSKSIAGSDDTDLVIKLH
jgi:hypothetical protein